MVEKNTKKTNYDVICFILGILSFLFFWVPIISTVGAIVAIVLFFKQRRKGSNGLSIAGLVLAILSLLVGLLVFIIFLGVFFVAINEISDISSVEEKAFIKMENAEKDANRVDMGERELSSYSNFSNLEIYYDDFYKYTVYFDDNLYFLEGDYWSDFYIYFEKINLDEDGTEKYPTFISGMVEDISFVEGSIDAISSLIISNWENDGFVYESQKNVVINGINGRSVLFSYVNPDYGYVNTNVEVFLLPSGDNLYMLMYAATEHDFDKYLLDAEKIISSFELQ